MNDCKNGPPSFSWSRWFHVPDIPQERAPQRIVGHFVDDPMPKFVEGIGEVVVPQILKEIVETVQLVPQSTAINDSESRCFFLRAAGRAGPCWWCWRDAKGCILMRHCWRRASVACKFLVGRHGGLLLFL